MMGDGCLQELYSVFEAIEGGDPDILRAWHAKYREKGTLELRTVEDSVESHKGKERNILGSPLYVACVCDQAKALRVLLQLGEDPNYVHPAHGDTPLLHCSENGSVECLSVLLQAPSLRVREALTVDRKVVLGQGIQNFYEGGRSPLLLAATGSLHTRVEV